ncbi:MAG TPA: hypothetical protein V6C91_08055 [Coleofasciculaceae cyanobacterium]
MAYRYSIVPPLGDVYLIILAQDGNNAFRYEEKSFIRARHQQPINPCLDINVVVPKSANGSSLSSGG